MELLHLPLIKSFITGSVAYGTPTETSDIDVVVLMSPEDACRILHYTGDVETISSLSTRFDKLNLIVCPDTELGRKAFQVWHNVTEKLKSMAPVTREFAVQEFIEARKEAEIITLYP